MAIDNFKGNSTTILALIWTVLCPYISQYVSQDVFMALCGAIIIAVSAYYPNTMKMFGNNTNTLEETDPQVLNREYETVDDYADQ